MIRLARLDNTGELLDRSALGTCSMHSICDAFRNHVRPARKVAVRPAKLDIVVSPWIAQPAALLPA